jgi:hypothetical protein
MDKFLKSDEYYAYKKKNKKRLDDLNSKAEKYYNTPEIIKLQKNIEVLQKEVY